MSLSSAPAYAGSSLLRHMVKDSIIKRTVSPEVVIGVTAGAGIILSILSKRLNNGARKVLHIKHPTLLDDNRPIYDFIRSK